MKTLYESLLDDDLINKTDNMIKDEIKAFLKINYIGSIKISNFPNKDGKYEVSSTTDIGVKNRNITSLTNGAFIWTEVDGSFWISYCNSLKSLEGAPEKVGKNFNCNGCDYLTSLEGAPKEVGWDFSCSCCRSLKTLKGVPEKVGGSFNCSYCNSLTSLKGAPEKVGGSFDCSMCTSLKSLEGAPKKVGKDFKCVSQFTIEDVKKISNVKGEIEC